MAENGQKGSVDLSQLKISPGSRIKKGNARYLITGFILLIASATVLIYVVHDKPVEVSVEPARVADFRSSMPVLNASGYVTPRRRATIAAKITGRVAELFVDEGMPVEENQVLARLDEAEAVGLLNASQADLHVAQAAIAELKVNIAQAERDLSRLKSLFDRNMVSRQDLDTAQTAVAGLKAKLNLADSQVAAAKARLKVNEQNLDNYTIRAPFSGIIVSKDAQIGEMV
jgi:RND family efflux transporter MFP subunit